LDIPLACSANLFVVVKLFLLVSSIHLQESLVKKQVENRLEHEKNKNDLNLIANIIVPLRVDVSEPSFENHVRESVVCMLQHVHANKDWQNNHIYAQTDEDRECHQPILVSFECVPYAGDKRLNDRVEKPIQNQDHQSSHDVVELVELLENDVILANLVFFSFVWLVPHHVFFDVVGELVNPIVSVRKESRAEPL